MDKNRQETAVEWLESKFQKFLLYYEGNHKAEPYTIQELSNDFEQAKQMEREQLHKCASFWRGKESEIEKQIFEQYYNQTYGNNQTK